MPTPPPPPLVDPYVPTPHLGVVFDYAPLSLAVVASAGMVNNSRFEVASTAGLLWVVGSGTTMAISTAAPMAGTRSLALSRTSTTGTASASLPTHNVIDVTVVAEKTYLLWFPIRPAPGGTNRQVTLTWTWKNVSQTTLSSTVKVQTEGTGYVDVHGYTWIGVISTAPATATSFVLDVAVAGVPTGEPHLVDQWFARMFGMDVASLLRARPGEIRGRDSDQTAEFPAGTASWLLANDDAAFTPGKSGAWPVSLRQPITLVWEWNGNLYPEFAGHTAGWKASPRADGLSDVLVTATGYTTLLARRTIDTPYRAEVLLNGPSGYLPLTEPSTATAAGTLSGDGAIAPLVAAVAGSGGATFGDTDFGPIIWPPADPGYGTVLRMGADVTSSRGDVLDLSAVPGALYGGGGQGWSFAFWAQWANDATTQVVFRQVAGFNLQTGIQVQITSNAVRIATSSEGVTAPTSDASQYGFAFVTYDPTVGAFGQIRIRLWRGGAFYLSPTTASLTLTASAWANGVPVYAHAGGAWTPSTGAVSSPLRGTLEQPAIFTKVVADGRQDIVYQLGNQAGFAEDEVQRAEGVLALTGRWRVPLTRADAGLTQMQQREWPTASNALTLARGYLGDAGAQIHEAADGRLVVRNRHHRSGQTTPRFTFDGALAPARRDIAVQLDDGAHSNVVDVRRPGGGRWRLVDQASIDANEVTEATTLTPRVNTDADAVALGQAVLDAYSTPRADIREVVLLLYRGDSDLIEAALRIEIGDLITAGSLPDTAPASTVTGYVEKKISWSDGKLRAMCVKLLISPQDSVVSW